MVVVNSKSCGSGATSAPEAPGNNDSTLSEIFRSTSKTLVVDVVAVVGDEDAIACEGPREG